jgi:phosphocarrier protein HPr
MSEAAEQVEQEVVIINRQGLHARPVMKFVDLAMQFKCEIKVRNGDQQVDGKSPMEMMLLIGTPGSRLLLRASGPDARPAVDALAQLINSKFGED